MAYLKQYDKDTARSYVADKEGSWLDRRLVTRCLARLPRTESIVDVPCGGGRMTTLLAELGFRPAAADVSPAMIDLARERFNVRRLEIPVEPQDLEKTTWPDGRFDNVLCFRLFHHLPTEELRAKVIGELCRVARRRVVLSYLDSRTIRSRRRKRAGSQKKHPALPAEMAAYFARFGFRVTKDVARFPLRSLRMLVAER